MSNATEARTVRSVQYWPGGWQLHLSGSVHAPLASADGLRVHARYADAAGREATEAERAEAEIQERAEMLLDREVYCQDDALVTALIETADDGSTGPASAFSVDEIENARPDPSDWGLGRCVDWLRGEGHAMPRPNPLELDRAALSDVLEIYGESAAADGHDATPAAELRERAVEFIENDSDDAGVAGWGIETWREAVRDNATDAEVMQWWRVSPYLLDALRGIGAVVLDNDYGEWWGRTCCGQGVIMDGTLQDAARHIEARHVALLVELGVK